MEFTVDEFNPVKPRVIINDVELEFNILTLRTDGILKDKYGSVNAVFDHIKVSPMEIYEVSWILLVKKEMFDYSPKKWREFACKQAVNNTKKLIFVINDSFGKSVPIIRNRKKYDDLLKMHQENGEKKICYGTYYDKIAKRYSYTIHQFYELSLRQLHILLSIGSEQTYEELEVQAALQGRKLKPRMDFKDIDEADDKRMDDEAMDTFAREMKAYKEKQK